MVSEDPRADREDPRHDTFDPMSGGGDDADDVDVEENREEAREETESDDAA
jgi:hypothetical protein